MKTGAVLSTVQLTLLDTVAVFPHASFAVKVLICEKLHPLFVTEPSVDVIVVAPHASVEVAVPNEAAGSAGLHPRLISEYEPVKTGATLSAIHVTVLDIVAVLLQASLAVNVLDCERPQMLDTTRPSTEVMVTVPHPSSAVAVPSEPNGSDGLHPRSTVA